MRGIRSENWVRRLVKAAVSGTVAIPTAAFGYWYLASASQRQKECVGDAVENAPDVLRGGWSRALRSAWSGFILSLDYKWSLRGMDDESAEYAEALSKCHERAATRILNTCLKNTGLYIKFGQGLITMNHILPKEYTETLKVLQDKCLRRQSGK